MDKTRCPKCATAEMTNVTRGETANQSFLQTAPFQEKIGIDRYVCLACGYTEEWLSAAALEKAKKIYGRR